MLGMALFRDFPIVDVVTSQEALTQADVDLVTARFDYLRAKAGIEALIGRAL